MGDVSNGAQAPAPAAITEATDPKAQVPVPGAPGAQAGNPGDNSIKAAAAEAARKLKIDDQEIDESEVIKVFKERKGHQQAANKKLQEGIKLQKRSEEFLAAMKNPETLTDTLLKLGWEKKQIRDLAEKFLAGELEEEMLDPKDKELRDTRNKLKTYEEKEALSKKEQEQKENETLKAKYAKQYEEEFIEALKTTDLPATKDMVAEMAKYIARAAKIKMPMTALEAVKLVQQDVEARNKHLFSNLSPEAIVKLVGEDGLKKLREYDVSKLKDPSQHLKTPAPNEQGELNRKKEQGKRMTPTEWRIFNRK
jgi:hypothetical protein